jgi:hypothetical protein
LSPLKSGAVTTKVDTASPVKVCVSETGLTMHDVSMAGA